MTDYVPIGADGSRFARRSDLGSRRDLGFVLLISVARTFSVRETAFPTAIVAVGVMMVETEIKKTAEKEAGPLGKH